MTGLGDAVGTVDWSPLPHCGTLCRFAAALAFL